MTKPTLTDILDFAKKLQALLQEHHRINKHAFTSTIEVETGKKYARIVRCDSGPARSAYAFVSIEDGNIYKPDGWKRPAKHARGNIFDDKPLACCGVYGVAYLR